MIRSTILVSLSLLICACTGTIKQQDITQVVVSREDYQPPTDLELTVDEARYNTVQVVPMKPEKEERIYQVSLLKIQDTMQTEVLKLQICEEVHPKSQYCKDVLKKFCQVDELIDFRGGIHYKTYCKTLGSH